MRGGLLTRTGNDEEDDGEGPTQVHHHENVRCCSGERRMVVPQRGTVRVDDFWWLVWCLVEERNDTLCTEM
jgi:hypothetical protein